MIKQLRNPLTREYRELKDFFLSHDFPWFYFGSTTLISDSIPFYSHTLLERPEVTGIYSKSNSPYLDRISKVINDLLRVNDVEYNYLVRLSINSTYPLSKVRSTELHEDHTFPHKNILVYLTSSGGKTIVDNEKFDPHEDDIIVFSGMHQHLTPEKDRRVVIVGTFV